MRCAPRKLSALDLHNEKLLQARIKSSLAKKRLQDHKSQLLQALSRELQIGQRIQQGFLPAVLPRLAGWSLGACCTPARQVGGDFYDAHPLPGGALALVVADVCDKGVGAALYMALFRTLLRAMASQAPRDEAPPTTLRAQRGFRQRLHRHGARACKHVRHLVLRDPGAGQWPHALSQHRPRGSLCPAGKRQRPEAARHHGARGRVDDRQALHRAAAS